MTTKVKQKLLKKSTVFNGKKITLFSIDGVVWSSRDWEPEKIKERQETEKVRLDAVAEGEEGATTEKAAEPIAAEAEDDAILPIVEPKEKAAKEKKEGKVAATAGASSKKPKASSIKPKARETQGKVTKKKVQQKRRAA